ncbi:MAG: toll/interleukin-1 receptor domain-containing protein [Ktedonobacteraceae bacterium]
MQQTQDTIVPISVFYSYSHKDKIYQGKLKTHLSVMRRQGFISDVSDQDILPGQVWSDEINKHLKTADVILLLVSPDFIESDYCYSVEMEYAIQRHDAGEAFIIPIILRPCEWKHSPLGKFHALPTRGKPVVQWTRQDEAFNDIAQGIRRVVNNLRKRKGASQVTLKEENSIHYIRPLPKGSVRSLNKVLQKKRDDRSIGEKLQGLVALTDKSFSFREIGKRAKGFSLFLLFLFTILNIILLPYFVFQWSNSTICVFSLLFFGLLFLMGITNKSGAVAYFITFAFFVIWSIFGFDRIVGYYHVSLQPSWLLIIILVLSLLQLELFRPRFRRRRFLWFI